MAWEEEITDPKQKGLFEPFVVLPQTDTSLSVVNIVNNDLVADITLKEPIVLSDGRPDAEIRPIDVERMVVKDITIYDEQVIPFLASWLKRSSAQSSLLSNLPAGFWYQYLEDIVRKQRKLSTWLDDDDPNQMDFGYRVIFSPKVPADRADDRLDIINLFGRTVGSIHGFIWLNDNKYPEEVVTPEDISYMVVTKVEFDLDDPGVVDFWLNWRSQTPKANLSEAEYQIEAFKKRAAWIEEEEPQDKLFFDWAVYYIDDSKLEIRDWDNNLLAELFLHMDPLWPLLTDTTPVVLDYKEKSKGTIISPEDIVRLVIGNFKIYEPDIIPALNEWFGRVWISGGRVYHWDGQWANPLPNDTWYNEYRNVISAWLDKEKPQWEKLFDDDYYVIYDNLLAHPYLEFRDRNNNIAAEIYFNKISLNSDLSHGDRVFPTDINRISIIGVAIYDQDIIPFIREWLEPIEILYWDSIKREWSEPVDDTYWHPKIREIMKSSAWFEERPRPQRERLFDDFDVIFNNGPFRPRLEFRDKNNRLAAEVFFQKIYNFNSELSHGDRVSPTDVRGISIIDVMIYNQDVIPFMAEWFEPIGSGAYWPIIRERMKTSASAWFDEENKDQLEISSTYSVRFKDRNILEIVSPSGDVVGLIYGDMSFSPFPEEGEEVHPESLEFIEVSEIVGVEDPNSKEFLRSWFEKARLAGAPCEWEQNHWIDDYEYGTASWREREYIRVLEDLVKVHNELPSYSYDGFDYWWTDEDLEYELSDEPDEYGLYWYNVIVLQPMPPEIVLEPDTWSELCEEAFGNYGLIDPLIEVPKFILEEDAQQVDPDGNPTESYDAWQSVGGLGYIDSEIKKFMTAYASYPEITAWLQELDNKLTSSNVIPGQDQLPDTFSSHKLSDSNWITEENEDQITLESEYYMQYYQGTLAVKDEMWDKIHTTILISEISPRCIDGDRVEPENVELVEVEELRLTTPTINDFIVNWFTQVNSHGGIAAWSKRQALENGDYDYATADWRDRAYIDNLDDLLEVYDSLDFFTVDMYDYEWDLDDVTFELDDDVDDYGLHEYDAIVWYPLPPEIVLTPQKWEELIQEWVQGGKNPIYLEALYAVPRFIIDEPEQNYNWRGGMTESYRAWLYAGGMDYLNSRFQQIKPGTLSSHKLSDSNWLTEENEDQISLENEYYMQYGKTDRMEFLAVKGPLWDKTYATVLIDRIYPPFTSGDRVEPEDVELVEVEELYWENDRDEYRDFIINWFSQVNSHGGIATWSKKHALEYPDDFEYDYANWRGSINIEGLNDLLAVYRNLDDLTKEQYPHTYDWDLNDATYDLVDDIDEYNLYRYKVTVLIPYPPEIKLTPQKWEELVLSVSNYNYQSPVDPDYWNALYEVPKFILEDFAQKYNANGTVAETYQAWMEAGSMHYVNSRLEQAKRRFPDQG
jgi:hypothetical protein